MLRAIDEQRLGLSFKASRWPAVRKGLASMSDSTARASSSRTTSNSSLPLRIAAGDASAIRYCLPSKAIVSLRPMTAAATRRSGAIAGLARLAGWYPVRSESLSTNSTPHGPTRLLTSNFRRSREEVVCIGGRDVRQLEEYAPLLVVGMYEQPLDHPLGVVRRERLFQLSGDGPTRATQRSSVPEKHPRSSSAQTPASSTVHDQTDPLRQGTLSRHRQAWPASVRLTRSRSPHAAEKFH